MQNSSNKFLINDHQNERLQLNFKKTLPLFTYTYILRLIGCHRLHLPSLYRRSQGVQWVYVRAFPGRRNLFGVIYRGKL